MKKIIFVYGGIAGSIVIGIIVGSMLIFDPGSGMMASARFGYLIMIIALSLVFIGIKSYRDHEQGGVISFKKAFLVGIGITMVAGIVYTGVWEIYIQATGGEFIDNYTNVQVEQMRESGASESAISDKIQEMESFREMYENPFIRTGITFLEIFPVGLIITLISAALLRKSEVLPAVES